MGARGNRAKVGDNDENTKNGINKEGLTYALKKDKGKPLVDKNFLYV